jgi:hypothetical protein
MTSAVTGGVGDLLGGAASEPVGEVVTALPGSQGDSKQWGMIKGLVTGEAGLRGGVTAPDATTAVRDISKILQLQTELQRYQLRVEVVSKVSECAVATVRKLQQQ